jgi:hypothetical protein
LLQSNLLLKKMATNVHGSQCPYKYFVFSQYVGRCLKTRRYVCRYRLKDFKCLQLLPSHDQPSR